MGMNTDRGVDEFVLLGQLDAAIQIPRPVAVSNCDDRLDARVAGPRDHLFAVSLKLFAIKMRVGIDESRSLVVGSLVRAEV